MTVVATDVEKLSEYYQELADLHANYAKQIREIEERFKVSKGKDNTIRLKRGDLPSLILQILSDFPDTGLGVKKITDIIWNKGYRTRGGVCGIKARKSLYQMVYQAL